jgi:hypothetical protein
MSTATRDPYDVAGSIRRNLTQIVDNYDDALLNAKGAANEIRVFGGGCEPVSVHALDVRAAAHKDLAYWVRFALDELNGGTLTAQTVKGAAVPDLAAFLTTWALALAEQLPDDADNLERDTGRHGSNLHALAKGWTERKMQIPGRCPVQILTVSPELVEELVPCTGTLWAVMREKDNGLLPRVVRCDQEDAHQWEPHDWRDLGRALGTSVL